MALYVCGAVCLCFIQFRFSIRKIAVCTVGVDINAKFKVGSTESPLGDFHSLYGFIYFIFAAMFSSSSSSLLLLLLLLCVISSKRIYRFMPAFHVPIRYMYIVCIVWYIDASVACLIIQSYWIVDLLVILQPKLLNHPLNQYDSLALYLWLDPGRRIFMWFFGFFAFSFSISNFYDFSLIQFRERKIRNDLLICLSCEFWIELWIYVRAKTIKHLHLGIIINAKSNKNGLAHTFDQTWETFSYFSSLSNLMSYENEGHDDENVPFDLTNNLSSFSCHRMHLC